MTTNLSSLIKASLLLAVALLLTVTTAFAEDGPAMPSEDSIHASVNSDGSLSLKGTAQFFDLDFGGADAGFSHPGPVGVKAVTLGQHFYINDEKNSELLQQPKKEAAPTVMGFSAHERISAAGSLRIDSTGFHSNFHQNNPWLVWYSALAGALGKGWEANLPGQEQVVIEVKNNGQLSIDQDVVFIPMLSANDKFVTTATDKQITNEFRETIKTALAKVSGTDVATFPKGSTATAVKLLATFVADHDLSVSVPDLRAVAIPEQDERSLRIVRLCTILEAGYLYDQADHLRTQLDKSVQHRFIAPDAPHRLVSMGPGVHYTPAGGLVISGNVLFIDYGVTKRIQPLDSANAKIVDDFFDRCLLKSDYATAEKFAKKLMCTGNLLSRQKLIANIAGEQNNLDR